MTELSWAPNDPYFPIAGTPPEFQWGLRAMQFETAWDKARGHGYVAVIDGGLDNDGAPPLDLGGLPATYQNLPYGNYRAQFLVSPSAPVYNSIHGTHVIGIVGAIADNNTGTSGTCPLCSVSMSRFETDGFADIAVALKSTVERGIQVVNYSGGSVRPLGCADPALMTMCDAIVYASVDRDVLFVASAGNKYNQATQFPASVGEVLSVGGTQWLPLVWGLQPTGWAVWNYNSVEGSSKAGVEGVVAPAKAIVSTGIDGQGYVPALPYQMCGDSAASDESGHPVDGFASCTGTSMSAPIISGLAGILRSINPLLSFEQIKEIIRSASNNANGPNALRGHGMPSANKAVNLTLAQTPSRLKPLFSMYSSRRLDYFYTTVPQMASVASWGTLRPVNNPTLASRYESTNGNPVQGYGYFPGMYPPGLPSYASLAAVWIFSTHVNPKSATVPLIPLYRMSWKCGDRHVLRRHTAPCIQIDTPRHK
ncbi:MAG: S8 family serine peptidase [Pseudomonadota bacterium]|nr:S8 family serine peptidase [Pseudomonadota bacterium]